MSTLRALLDYEAFTDAYVNEGSKIPTPLTDLFYQNPSDELSDEVSFFYSQMTRSPAPINNRGAVARVLDMRGRTKKEAAMFVQFSVQKFGNEVMNAVLDDDNSRILAARAAKEIDFQIEYAAHRHVVTKEAILGKILTTGQVIFDVNGDIVETNSGDDNTYTFGLSATHLNQLNSIISASWATDGTLILDQIDAIDVAAANAGLPIPDTIFMNSTMKVHLRSNTQFATWIASSPNLAEQAMMGTVIPFGGKQLVFLDHTYVNAAGTTVKVIPDNMAVFVPTKDKTWIQPLRGQTQIPTSIDVGAGLSSLQEVYGQFGYTKLSENPVALHSYTGDVFGWAMKEMDAVWAATVVGF